jgi:hypothetical protein
MTKHRYSGSGIVMSALAVAALSLGVDVDAQGAGKRNICHKTGGGFQVLSVNANAVQGHLGHGDLQPGAFVTGSTSAVVGADCSIVSWDHAVNVSLDESAQTIAGNLLVGSGIPAVNYGTARNEVAGIELGMGVIYRQGPTVASTDDYADGVLRFTVNDGPQSTTNGSFSNVANRAAWSFNFSVATGLNGATTDLSDFTFKLLYDVDPGPGTLYRPLTMEPGGTSPSGYWWTDDETGIALITGDGGNATVTQNSQNYGFSFYQFLLTSPYGPANNFAGPAQFDIILQAFDGAQLIAQNHIVVDVDGGL